MKAQRFAASKCEALAGADYTLNKQLSLIAQWHSEFGLGGLSIRF